MKLIGSLTSPYVRKVRIVLAEKKLECMFEIDSPWSPDSKVPNINPLGKVPVLLLDDTTPVYDSRVIVEYLDASTANNRLIPSNGRERLMVRRWEALADGICDAAASAFLESKRPLAQQSTDWIGRQNGKIAEGIKAMSDELGAQPWCHTKGFSLADIAVGVALGYLDLRNSDLLWRGHYPNLAKLFDKLSTRASFADTVPVV
jgi:glutathione S-transferase